MAPLPFIEDCAEFRLHWVSASRLDAINVLHFRKKDGTAWDADDIGTVTGLLAAAWDTALAPAVSEEVFLADITGTGLDAADSTQIKTITNDPGEKAGSQLLPFQTAACLSLATATRGKSGRGRVYLTGFCEIDSAGASVGGDVLTAVNAFGDALLDIGTDPDYELVVISYYTGGNKNAEPPTESEPRAVPVVNAVIGARCDLNWKTQRRRSLVG